MLKQIFPILCLTKQLAGCFYDLFCKYNTEIDAVDETPSEHSCSVLHRVYFGVRAYNTHFLNSVGHAGWFSSF